MKILFIFVIAYNTIMRTNQEISLRPCAKINLGLYVTERRADGYHNLETVFYPIPLCDDLHIALSNEDKLTLEGFALEGNPMDNLVMKAVGKLRAEGYEVPPVHITLRKNIPSGAGLGGGSSDAAYVMRGLNDLLDLNIPASRLQEMVATLGADCAFFITDTPMYATGIGDILAPCEVNLADYWITLVKPDDFVSTREAYSGVTPSKPQYDLQKSLRADIRCWQQTVSNDFEQSILPQHPAISEIKQKLLDAGALFASMSGSGSTVFGIFAKQTYIDTPYFQFTSKL